MIYGVLQSHYGQDIRYLFTEDQIIAESRRTGSDADLCHDDCGYSGASGRDTERF